MFIVCSFRLATQKYCFFVIRARKYLQKCKIYTERVV